MPRSRIFSMITWLWGPENSSVPVMFSSNASSRSGSTNCLTVHLLFTHGILPNISVGVQARGGFPIGSTRVDYAFYVSNGPVLNTFDARSAGTLAFNSYTDNNDNQAAGGRVGFLPIPGLPAGSGLETSQPALERPPL